MSLHGDYRFTCCGDIIEVWCHRRRRWFPILPRESRHGISVTCSGCLTHVDDRLNPETRDAIIRAA